MTAQPGAPSRPFPNSSCLLTGISGSPGLASGPALIIDNRTHGVVRRHISPDTVNDELRRFADAVRVASGELHLIADRLKTGNHLSAEVSIVEAYVLMVGDETLRSAVEQHIREGLLCAEWATDSAVKAMAAQLRMGADPYLAERSHDFDFIGARILRALAGPGEQVVVLDGQRPCILVAYDLSPAETASLSKDRVLGIVTEAGTRTSHTAIIARALELPAVVGVAGLLSKIGNGDTVLLDALRGEVMVNPAGPLSNTFVERAQRYRQVLHERRSSGARGVATRCGVPIEILANIELPEEANIALAHGARGVGLYRTEFQFLGRTEPPSEDEQYEVYRRIAELVAPLPVTLRTFDLGGDKFSSAVGLHTESNPALGLRAIRLALARPELLLPQLRAMVRASAHGAIKLMVPMISSIRELREIRILLKKAILEVERAGQAHAAEIPLGIMVEVPSAAVLADEFAKLTSFMSIGTNDLVQYALAVDRSSPELTYLASFFDPAVLRLIRFVVNAGRTDCPVCLCGAMASDPLAAVLLIGMGIRQLSMEASAIAEVREAIGMVTLAEAQAVAREAFEQCTAEEVENLLAARFAERLCFNL